MTTEQAKSELMQLYMSLSEEKKKALDVLMAQADGEKTCGTCRNEDTYHCADCENKSDYEQAQADGDLISRQAAIKSIGEKAKRIKNEDTLNGLAGAVGILFDLPSFKPQPKTGHWEWVPYDYNPKLGDWHCSECRCVVVECVGKNEKGGIPFYKYCPQCGAKMVDPQESEDKE